MIPATLAARLDLATIDEIRRLIEAAKDERTREIHERVQREQLNGTLFADAWIYQWYPAAFGGRFTEARGGE